MVTLTPVKRTVLSLLAVLVLSIVVTACEDDERLPGTRLAIFSADESLLTQGQTQPVRLTAAYQNQAWPMPGGVASHAPYHLAIAEQPNRRWTRDIGIADNARQKITAPPVVVDGLVYAMDAAMNVSAHRLDDGALIWRVNVSDPAESSPTFGGGMSFGDGKLYVTTGDAEIYALAPRTGQAIWRAKLAGPARNGATFDGGQLFVQTLNNRTQALLASTGQVLWTHQGIQETTTIVRTSAPAVVDQFVYVAYSSGEIYALIRDTGAEAWTDIIAAAGPSAGRLALELVDINALPVVDRGLLVVSSNGGRTVGYDINRGLPAWEYAGGGTQTPAMGEGHVFLVTNEGTAVALSRDTGRPAWIKDLGSNATRSGGKKVEWFGPLIASDRLLFADNRGKLIALSPFDGRLLGEISLGQGVAVPPVIAAGHLIFLTEGADLLVYR